MRKINELIWHCTATPEGREVSVKEIDSWHKARGWSGIGYHKVIHLDGSVSPGRPESQVGAHVAGRNANTIGYSYVGGVDANNKKKGKDTRTPAQKKTMERLTREAIAKYKLTMVSGHSDYANKACPCFNARKEYAHLLKTPNKEGMPVDDPAMDISSLKGSRTIAGSGMATFGAFGSTETVSELTTQLSPYTEFSIVLKYAFVALTLLGIALVVYARWDDAGRPLPWKRRS